MRTTYSFPLLVAAALLVGCSRMGKPSGKPNLEVDGFFVCQKCACLSAINGGEPPAVIPVHAIVCPEHTWDRISKRDYIRKASKDPLQMLLIPPTRELTVSTSWGDTGLLLYPSAFVFCVGPTWYVLSVSPARVGCALAGLGLVALVGRLIWKRRNV